MRVQIALLLLIALFAASATAGSYTTEAPAPVCKYITQKKCSTVNKKVPVQKQKKVTTYKKEKYIKTTKVAYQSPVCKTVRSKVPYKKAQAYQVTIKYQVNQDSTRPEQYQEEYVVKVPFTKQEEYKVKRTCKRVRETKVPYTKKHSKKYWHSYQSKCPSTRKERRTKQVPAVQCYECTKQVDAVKTVKIKVPIKITKRRKKYTGRHVLSEKPGDDPEHPCYRKEWIWENYTVDGFKDGTKQVKYKKSVKATCHRNIKKTVVYYVTVPCEIPCTKRVQKVKVWTTKHTRIVKTPYTHTYYVTKTRTLNLVRTEKRTRTKTRMVPCVIKVDKTRQETRFRDVTLYRTVSQTKTEYVTKYRNKSEIAYKNVPVVTYKKYTDYVTKAVKVCADVKTKVCKVW